MDPRGKLHDRNLFRGILHWKLQKESPPVFPLPITAVNCESIHMARMSPRNSKTPNIGVGRLAALLHIQGVSGTNLWPDVDSSAVIHSSFSVRPCKDLNCSSKPGPFAPVSYTDYSFNIYHQTPKNLDIMALQQPEFDRVPTAK